MVKYGYEPRPVYCRKLLRSVLRGVVTKKFGMHNVSRTMSYNFENIRKKGKNSNKIVARG